MRANFLRLIGVGLSIFLLTQIASVLLQSGATQKLLASVNPTDPRRQLERSITAVSRGSDGDVAIVGHTAFIQAMHDSCKLDGNVLSVPIDRGGWRDYDLATVHLVQKRPSLIIFQARPFLWTNLLHPWPPQRTDQLARTAIGAFPLEAVRAVIRAVGETARGSSLEDGNSGVFSFIGAKFERKQSDRFMARIARTLSQSGYEPKAVFAFNSEEIPADALADTKREIVSEFDGQERFPGIRLDLVDVVTEKFGCDRSAQSAVADRMRRSVVVIDQGEEDES